MATWRRLDGERGPKWSVIDSGVPDISAATDDNPYGFDLPEDRIALRPAEPRSSARMLFTGPGCGIRDLFVRDLPGCLSPGDLLVVNDTRVLRARIRGKRLRGFGQAGIEITLLRPLDRGRWQVLARPLKRLAAGDRIEFGRTLLAKVEARTRDSAILEFDRTGKAFHRALQEIGELPLPPYISRHRPVDMRDDVHYQTIFANTPGAVAAPTAGLHFDGPLLDSLREREVRMARVTLHVGGGTFLPVRPDGGKSTALVAEWGTVGAGAATEVNSALSRGSRVIAVGTTTLRLLETVAAADSPFRPWEGETTLFIRPGHRFRIVRGLLTNFHLPNSTLFVLACAFLGTRRCRDVYRHALDNNYRFYSYGDASLLYRD